ncbi:sugar transporter [Haematobacter massiliensis]|uniref:TRAP transporter small permease protein n=1 Tax=Haematobacter massiliensis TaxID=195105 RepID=A0A086YBL1_9RHOB|nr:TRAP transporter small permease subunit [Haematobacter massiliensis]KFI31661.1 sugar transporter [Haematobacter massiliensis]OWJ72050.1 sugar transporter [Haematobacter massiliensis]OWJ81554.1 sugar transporter [Haematobacter massiliensis]QBJ24055.1 TRAP transporter small permease subunit [Haematobacter massiliensis]
MKALLALSGLIDRVNEFFGRIGEYLVLLCALVSAFNALIRYTFNISSNGWLEIQWYMFAFVVLMGAAYTLKNNEHVRVDVIYGSLSERGRLWVDLFGIIIFLLPFSLYCAVLNWPVFLLSWQQGEVSQNAGGLIRWPVKLVLTAGFAMLFLQGLSELIKRVAALQGRYSLETKYEKPLQ